MPIAYGAEEREFWTITPSQMYGGYDIYMVLEPGTYTFAGLPVYAMMNVGAEIPNVRRTFYGGGLSLDSAVTYDLRAGEVAELELQMVENGHSITGKLTDPEGAAIHATVALIDETNKIVCSNISYNDSGYYFLSGVPSGIYFILAVVEDPVCLLSTWYPNVSSPGATPIFFEIPREAWGVEINDADLHEVDIQLQRGEGYTSVPSDRGKNVAVDGFRLSAPSPNPFNSVMNIHYQQPKLETVNLSVYDIEGRLVEVLFNGQLSAGDHSFNWAAGGHSTGMFVVTVTSGQFRQSRKVVYLK